MKRRPHRQRVVAPRPDLELRDMVTVRGRDGEPVTAELLTHYSPCETQPEYPFISTIFASGTQMGKHVLTVDGWCAWRVAANEQAACRVHRDLLEAASAGQLVVVPSRGPEWHGAWEIHTADCPAATGGRCTRAL